LPGLAESLDSLADRQTEVGRFEEALAAQEAVLLNGELTQRNRDAFATEFARSQGTLGHALAACRRPAEAAAAFADGLRTVLPFAARHPQALADLCGALFSGYTTALREANLDPDSELVDQAMRILGSHPAGRT